MLVAITVACCVDSLFPVALRLGNPWIVLVTGAVLRTDSTLCTKWENLGACIYKEVFLKKSSHFVLLQTPKIITKSKQFNSPKS
jgi:hypothetical protein